MLLLMLLLLLHAAWAIQVWPPRPRPFQPNVFSPLYVTYKKPSASLWSSYIDDINAAGGNAEHKVSSTGQVKRCDDVCPPAPSREGGSAHNPTWTVIQQNGPNHLGSWALPP